MNPGGWLWLHVNQRQQWLCRWYLSRRKNHGRKRSWALLNMKLENETAVVLLKTSNAFLWRCHDPTNFTCMATFVSKSKHAQSIIYRYWSSDNYQQSICQYIVYIISVSVALVYILQLDICIQLTKLCCFSIEWQIDGLVQDCSTSIPLTIEIPQSCTKPSKWYQISIILVNIAEYLQQFIWHYLND